MAKIIAVCASEEKSTRKRNISKGTFRKNYGLLGDAHADSKTHRQISLLALESIDKMRECGLEVGPGDFAENLTTQGIELHSLPIGTKVSVGETVLLEVTQIGKECHSGCAIFRQIGKCIMPKEGIFAQVIQGGVVKENDEIIVCEDKR
ncbi:MAG: MOSC domain-containing protein [Thermodesulfobacteriota bacterium]|nr:MOSC domain-containing protein [Thermodesulfobacteriota bacterium]